MKNNQYDQRYVIESLFNRVAHHFEKNIERDTDYNRLSSTKKLKRQEAKNGWQNWMVNFDVRET